MLSIIDHREMTYPGINRLFSKELKDSDFFEHENWNSPCYRLDKMQSEESEGKLIGYLFIVNIKYERLSL